jgi:sulfatase modifying factor 1
MLVYQIIHDDPPSPRKLDANVARDLETICLKCLRKEPNRRYSTTAALADDLRRWLEGRPIIARRVSRAERAWLWCKRRPAIAAMTCALILTITVSGIVIRAHHLQTEKQRARALANGVITARADGVPYALEKLRPIGHLAIADLQRHLAVSEGDPLQQLHAAYALADLGLPPEQFLLDAVSTAPAQESGNLLAALEHRKALVLPELARRADLSSEPTAQARYAIVALQLGDPGLAGKALAVREDPIRRTILMHLYPEWHGDLTAVAEFLRTSDDEMTRSGLCAAVGSISPGELGSAERGALIRAFTHLYLNAPDGGTHSAAGWALRAWNQALPRIEEAADPPTGRQWFVNHQGMTMIEIQSGSFMTYFGVDGNPGSETREVTVTQPFLLCDREVTIDQFQRFADDSEYPAAEKPDQWTGVRAPYSTTPDHPIHQVCWFDAILYCNWLSKREGKSPCYKRTGTKETIAQSDATPREVDVWMCDLAENGYRLPTEAEWELACRAGSARTFCFGDDQGFVTAYAWLDINSRTSPRPGGLKLPNAWGLFDMHGNVCEWCWDLREGKHRGNRAVRGGAFLYIAPLIRSDLPAADSPTSRSGLFGFRVARNCR